MAPLPYWNWSISTLSLLSLGRIPNEELDIPVLIDSEFKSFIILSSNESIVICGHGLRFDPVGYRERPSPIDRNGMRGRHRRSTTEVC